MNLNFVRVLFMFCSLVVLANAQTSAKFEHIGISCGVPAGATAENQVLGDRAIVRISERLKPTWIIEITIVDEPEKEPSPRRVADKIRDKILTSGAADTTTQSLHHAAKNEMRAVKEDRRPVVLLQETARTIPGGRVGIPTERVVLRIPQQTEDWVLIRDVTLIPQTISRYVAVSLFASEEVYQPTRQVYEDVLASIEFLDAEKIEQGRAALVAAGQSLLANLDEAGIRALVKDLYSTRRYERLYRQNASKDFGGEDLGYRYYEARIGRRGEVDPKGRKTGPEGVLLTIGSRLVPDSDTYIDIWSSFFVSFDGQEELWVVDTKKHSKIKGNVLDMRTERNPSPVPGWTTDHARETGSRVGKSAQSNITLSGTDSEFIEPVIPDTGYVSQVYSLLLGPILVRAGTPIDTGFYAYQSAFRAVHLRTDSLTRHDGAEVTWEVATKLTQDSPTFRSFYLDDGTLIKMDYGDGRVWEPIGLQKLGQIWKHKGLPLN